jgi:hypothetical protein
MKAPRLFNTVAVGLAFDLHLHDDLSWSVTVKVRRTSSCSWHLSVRLPRLLWRCPGRGPIFAIMCGRFTQSYTWHEIHDLYGLTGPARNLQAHYNIAPTDPVDVVRPGAGGTELVSMRWGFVPYWWKKPLKQLPATFNARAESLAGKPMFREAFARHRCIIPASGLLRVA